MYTPEKVCKIVVACCIVHNIAIRHGMPLDIPEDMEEPPEDMDAFGGVHPQHEMAGGRRLREDIVQRYFT